MKTRYTSTQTATSIRGVTPAETETIRNEIIDWLRDAYAMERGLEQALEKSSKNEDLLPEVRTRAAAHLEETRRHAEKVKSALMSLDADTSGLKTAMGVVAQAAKGMGSAFTGDERIKDMLDAYSSEHLEIACYTALSAAAERAGLTAVVETCQSILPDEERMADALLKAIPSEISSYLFEKAAKE